MRNSLGHARGLLARAFRHDLLNTAKACAYSGILMLFPAMLVLTTLLALTPESERLRFEVRSSFEQMLPGDTMNLLQDYFASERVRSIQAIISALGLSLFAALGVMLSLMEGFRRAYAIPRAAVGFWRSRLVALLLIPTCLVPMAFSAVLLIFGHPIERWMVDNADHVLRGYVVFLWRVVRWTISMFTSVSVLAIIYHFGVRRNEHWTWVLPGAVGASLFWFPATVAFGWYVTRFADYSVVYGSLGAVIATLVWLYLTSLAVLAGAELNAQLHHARLERDS